MTMEPPRPGSLRDAVGQVVAKPSGALVVTGPPGAGKTTVARLVARMWPRSVCLDGDQFWHSIVRGSVPPWTDDANEQNGTCVDVLGACTSIYARAGYMVVVDGVLGPWFLERFLVQPRAAGVAVHYVVLRPSAEVALTRAQARSGRALTESRPIRAMYEDFRELAALERHVVDNSAQSASKTAQVVRDLLDQGALSLAR